MEAFSASVVCGDSWVADTRTIEFTEALIQDVVAGVVDWFPANVVDCFDERWEC